MWIQVDVILREAAAQIADHIANFLPGVLVSLVLIVAALVVAVVVRLVVSRILQGLEFDRRAEQLGFSTANEWSTTPSSTVARFVYWTVVILGLLVSLTALNAATPSRLALSVIEYVPHLLAALMIVVVGTIAARFLARAVLIEAVNMQLQAARLLSLTVKWLVLLVATAMALDHLGLGRDVLLLAFGILFGGVVLAAALAVGLGARGAVGRMIDRTTEDPPRNDDHVSHV